MNKISFRIGKLLITYYRRVSSKKLDNHDISEWKQLILKNNRFNILKENHDEPLDHHLGVYKTSNRISQIYYWPKVRKDIAKYISKCRACLANKVPSLGQQD